MKIVHGASTLQIFMYRVCCILQKFPTPMRRCLQKKLFLTKFPKISKYAPYEFSEKNMEMRLTRRLLRLAGFPIDFLITIVLCLVHLKHLCLHLLRGPFRARHTRPLEFYR